MVTSFPRKRESRQNNRRQVPALPGCPNGIKLRLGPVLRLRRCRGYAQHERQFVNEFPHPVRPEPFDRLRTGYAERSRRAAFCQRPR